MEQNSKYKQSKTSLYLLTISAIALTAVIIYFAWPYLSALNDPEQVRYLILEAGAWGPLVYILMQVVQVLIAPIPGQVVGLIGGYLFGPILGVVYTVIGATIGFTLIFVLSRKLGRPFAERFVNKKILDKFDYLTKDKGPLVFFLIFLLPAFPDDIISFAAGLTTIRIRTLVLISLAGRLLGYIVLSLTGNGLTYENLNPVIITGVIMVIIFVVAWKKREWLHEFVERKDRISFVKAQWKASWLAIILWALGLLIVAISLYRLAAVTPIQK